MFSWFHATVEQLENLVFVEFPLFLLLILEGNKNGIFPREILLSEEEIIPFERYNAPWRAKTGTNDVTSQFKSRHFQMAEKPKTANLIIVIYKLMYL